MGSLVQNAESALVLGLGLFVQNKPWGAEPPYIKIVKDLGRQSLSRGCPQLRRTRPDWDFAKQSQSQERTVAKHLLLEISLAGAGIAGILCFLGCSLVSVVCG